MPYAEFAPGEWARVGVRLGVDVDMILDYSIRPSTERRRFSKVCTMKGAIYDFTFSTAHNKGQYLDYEKILTATMNVHDKVLHIFLNSFQGMLRVTFPAVTGSQSVISAAEDFYNACLLYRSGFFYRSLLKVKNGVDSSDPLEEYEKALHPFELIAAAWPHYVVPPSHPFAFLCPDMPCRFFVGST